MRRRLTLASRRAAFARASSSISSSGCLASPLLSSCSPSGAGVEASSVSGFLAVFARLAAGLPAGAAPAGRFEVEEEEATALVIVDFGRLGGLRANSGWAWVEGRSSLTGRGSVVDGGELPAS